MSRLTYGKYLKLKELLACQVLESAKAGRPAHDELLFIVTHQTYELWFKQVLHELGEARRIMGAELVNERDVGRALHALERVIKIQGVLVDQIDVLETMTPLDFLDFRNLLTPSSGFQSAQFRQLENALGLKRTQRLRYNEADYEASLDAADRRAVSAAEQTPSLFDVVEAWLARTPFVQFREFDFWREYRTNVTRMLDEDRATITAQLPDGARGAQLEELERTLATFESVFDPEKYEALRAAGERRLSYPAFLAALMIMLYRDEPILQSPYRLLTALVEIDENLALWRYRHALMVQRMIGAKIGTGGSSGQEYLRRTIEAHRVFLDFFNLSTYLIPRSLLPRLPAELERALGFRWNA
ncbi:MAG TPA: tryptophan 2,3-dioxygenase family protein [Burkholderiales bacterium]|nr:tryptophan 2,3-dioxygenase family protein [Burkholderiales bacterium]